MERQIRLDKFEQVLPRAMRDNGIDMWIVAVKENHYDPLWKDLGRGYVTGVGYYMFTDRGGDRIERIALGPSGYLINESGAYDGMSAASMLADFVKQRDPKRIGVNMSDEIGPADGLSVTMLAHLKKTLGEPYASRLVSAEKLVSEFRSRRVASEIVAFGEASGIAVQLAERALSNEVITVGKTTLEDVAWWLQDRLLEKGLGSEFDMPSVYVTGPNGIVATSTNRIVQPGDVMMIDWGVQLMNFGTDVKRVAYVLKPGETAAPKSIQQAFDKAISVRDVLKKAIKPGVRADETMKRMDAALAASRIRRRGVQPPQQGRQDRCRLRIPPGGQYRPRHRPIDDDVAAAAEHVRVEDAAHLLVRVFRLHARSRSGAARSFASRLRTTPSSPRTASSSSTRPTTVSSSSSRAGGQSRDVSVRPVRVR